MAEAKPVARPGLVTQDHEKQGRRFITALDRPNKRVTLLETAEHAVLLLCDGTRTAEEIEAEIGAEPGFVARTLLFLQARALIEGVVPTAVIFEDDAQTVSEEEPTNRTTEHADARGREVFDLLRKAGLKVRSAHEETSDPEDAERSRRRDPTAAKRFDDALASLTAGDLELSLAYFRSIQDRMRTSRRIRAFIEAIEQVRNDHLPVTQETDLALGMSVLDTSR